MALARLAGTFNRACRPVPQLLSKSFHAGSGRQFHAADGLSVSRNLLRDLEERSRSPVNRAASLWRHWYSTTPGEPVSKSGFANVTQTLTNALARVPKTAYNLLPEPAQTVVDTSRKPGALQRVISLQLNSFWQAHATKVYAAGGILAVYCLWRTMYAVTSVFINLSDTMAAGGFLALSASCVILGGLYLKRKHTIDVATACRLAMVKLNTHPGVLEVMGAPLVSSPVRASVITGGGLRFKGLRPRVRSKRAQIIFPLHGSDRRGLVSIEAKRRKGQYVFKLISVDVPTLSGTDQRIYVEGGPAIYERGGILNELREPFLRAVAAEETFLKEDEADDEADEQREEAEAKVNKPKPLDQGGGMYVWERAVLGVQELRRRLFAPAPLPKQPMKK